MLDISGLDLHILKILQAFGKQKSFIVGLRIQGPLTFPKRDKRHQQKASTRLNLSKNPKFWQSRASERGALLIWDAQSNKSIRLIMSFHKNKNYSIQVRSSIARARHQQWWLSTMGQKHQSRLEAVQGTKIQLFKTTFLIDNYVHRND